jgi:hypothetical protein
MTPSEAESQTAMATWWLFWATAATAIGTVGAVIVALLSSSSESRRRDRELQSRDAAALRSIIESRMFMREVCDRRKQDKPDTAERMLWSVLGRLSAQRKVCDHYLSQPMRNPELPYLLAETLQRNYEVRDAIDGLLPKNHGATWVTQANYTLKSASLRMDENEAAMDAVRKAIKLTG